MQRATRYLRTSVFFAALGVVLSVLATSADAGASIAGKQELEYDAPDMEKFLYDLNRYLYRQHQRHAQQPDEQLEEAEDDASSELSRLTHRDADAMANGATTKHRYQRRLSWPFWAAKAAARASEGGPASRADALSRPYEKRNSELINSLLGLPRVMKVVG